MSTAKQQKLREYGTDILSHDSQGSQNDQRNVRCNNTFKSSVMDTDPVGFNSQHAMSRERVFKDRPLTAKVQRASYQDSNIFGYKDEQNPTIQQASGREGSSTRARYNPTFQSNVFPDQSGPNETDRPVSKSRQEEKWMSTVFEGPIIEQARRKKLGGNDAGIENLFGQAKVDFDNKSNTMTVIGQKKECKKWKPVRQQKTAEQRKNDELHGRSAAIYGTGKKNDGTLMANGADWRNLQQTHVNSAVTQGADLQSSGNCRDKKFGNLQSNIFNQEEKQNQQSYDPTVERANFGTDANWSAQGGSAKVINKGYKQDAYKKKQQQLSSQVFEQTDYSQYQPMNKPKLDINNLADNKRKGDHLYSDILGSTNSNQTKQKGNGLKSNDQGNWNQSDTKSQIKKDSQNPSNKDQTQSQMKSCLDTHNYLASSVRQTEQPDNSLAVTIPGQHSTATKIRDLSSDVLGTGNAIQHYQNADREAVIVDLDLKGLPSSTQIEDIKKISGAKHIISAVVEQDAITNNCIGTGRIKLRLGGAEEVDNVKLQFLKAGYGVQEHSENTSKKTNFTQEQTLSIKSPLKKEVDAKASKLQNLQTNNPEIYGNNSKAQSKYNLNFDGKEQGQVKVANQSENLAISNWSKVGGKR